MALNGGYVTNEPSVKNSFHVGVMGDRPSGVRAGYILLNAGAGIHPKSIAGYFDPNGTNIIALSNMQAIRRCGEKNKTKTLRSYEFNTSKKRIVIVGRNKTIKKKRKTKRTGLRG